jgi:hypothetical protein
VLIIPSSWGSQLGATPHYQGRSQQKEQENKLGSSTQSAMVPTSLWHYIPWCRLASALCFIGADLHNFGFILVGTNLKSQIPKLVHQGQMSY